MSAVVAPAPASASTALPPRYSLVEGALPPLAASENTGSNTPSPSHTPLPTSPVQSEPESNNRRPPRYSSVFSRARVEQRERRQRARHAHAPSSSSHRHSTHSGTASFSSQNRTGPQLHEYHLRNGGGRTTPYATLRVYSRTSATGAGAMRIPKFVGADLVQGSLDLNLETPTNINSITLSLRGRIITSAYDGGSHAFLEHPITSWTRGHGDPRAMLLTPLPDPNEPCASSTTARPKKFDGKLAGTYSWPFSFAFPQTTTNAHTASNASNATPQTFSEKNVNASVQYELVLRMTHGILRSDSKLHAHVVYVPALAPPPQAGSALRDIAYRAGMCMPSPGVDPHGWSTVGKKMVQGRIFKERSVKLECTLSLANPQTYTRGTVIPCHLAIEGTDTQALDVLATPQTLSMRLVRRVRYYDYSATASTNSGSATVEEVKEIERAVWWSGTNNAKTDSAVSRRELEGEIHLEKELQPSCAFSLFQVSYTVELLPFATPVFQLAKENGSGSSSPSSPKSTFGPKVMMDSGEKNTPPPTILIAHPVTIATLPGEGPAPVAHTAPRPRVAKTRIQVQASSSAEYDYAPGASVRVVAGMGVYM